MSICHVRLAVACLSVVSLSVAAPATGRTDDNRTSTIRLFNGKNLDGWHIDCPKLDKDPKLRKPFIVRRGMLVSLGTPAGHLITDREFSNYRLVVEYRFAGKPGNCGVLVHASTPRALYKMFPKSLEVQMMHKNAGDFWCIVEDIEVPDMEKRRGPKEKWGITEGKARRIVNLTDGAEKPPGEWNTMVIECVRDEVKVWVNGVLVNHGKHCTATKGHIALQAEGSEVEFRKVELTPIPKLTPDGSARRAIEGVLQQQSKAWNRGDIEGFMQTYWKSDQLTFSGGGRTTRGWQATLERYKRRYPNRPAMGKLVFSDLEVTMLAPDAALVLGRWQLDKKPRATEGNFTLVLRKLNGEWQIIHDHSSAVAERPASDEQRPG